MANTTQSMVVIEEGREPLNHALDVLSLAYKILDSKRAAFKVKLLREAVAAFDDVRIRLEVAITLLEQGDPVDPQAGPRPPTEGLPS